MSMKALNRIAIPRVSKSDDFYGLQSEEENNNRLNANFRMIAAAILGLETSVDGVAAEVIAQLNLPSVYVTDTGSNGVWEWRKWSDGRIEAWATTISAAINCTTAYGALYGAETTISLPSDLFSNILTLSADPICATASAFLSVVSITASTVTVKVLTTVSSSIMVQFAMNVIGK